MSPESNRKKYEGVYTCFLECRPFDFLRQFEAAVSLLAYPESIVVEL